MAEMERLANHLGDIGAVCNEAAFAFMHAHFGVLHKDVLRAAKACFGHRLMMDKVIPGGVAADLDADGFMVMEKLIVGLRERLMKLMDVYDNSASLLDRTRKTGILSADLARQFAAGGYVGRAAGRDFDARRDLPCAPYDHLPFDVARLEAGDVDARIRIRMSEAMQSLTLYERIIRGMPEAIFSPDCPMRTARPPRAWLCARASGAMFCCGRGWMAKGASAAVTRAIPRCSSGRFWTR